MCTSVVRGFLVDIASLVGFLLGVGIIIAAIATGGDVMLFVNVPSLLIVIGGTLGVSLMRIPLADFTYAFFHKRISNFFAFQGK
jgi:chemotaxis protein MotA